MTTKPGGVLRLRARAGTVLTVAVALVGLLPTTSQANVNRYTVQANSPKPAVCNNSGTIPPGTWLQNKPCGYWVGTAMAGSSFDVHQTNPSNYHYGRSLGNNNICAWIPPGALGSSPTASVALGAMAVGPEFGPLAGLSTALVQRAPRLALRSL
ncbi:hypothetical protein ACWDSD_45515, partial [Streptomyces spiralis]